MATSETASTVQAVTSEGMSDDVELGDFSQEVLSQAASHKIVLATFNIRYAVGSFLISGGLLRRLGVKRPGRRHALVEKHLERASRTLTDNRLLPSPHVIALQEADRETIRAGAHHVARELAEKMRCSYAHAAQHIPRDEEPKRKQWYLDFEEHLPAHDSGETGLAILSRLPLSNVKRIELPWSECAWRPKLALQASVPFGAKKNLHLFNSHIDPHAGVRDQLAQHEVILACADEAAQEIDEPVALLGDFNTLTPQGRIETRRLLESRGYYTPIPTGTATWRAGLYRLHADWIFLRGAQVTRWGVARPLSVSDHWPVWVEIE